MPIDTLKLHSPDIDEPVRNWHEGVDGSELMRYVEELLEHSGANIAMEVTELTKLYGDRIILQDIEHGGYRCESTFFGTRDEACGAIEEIYEYHQVMMSGPGYKAEFQDRVITSEYAVVLRQSARRSTAYRIEVDNEYAVSVFCLDGNESKLDEVADPDESRAILRDFFEQSAVAKRHVEDRGGGETADEANADAKHKLRTLRPSTTSIE